MNEWYATYRTLSDHIRLIMMLKLWDSVLHGFVITDYMFNVGPTERLCAWTSIYVETKRQTTLPLHQGEHQYNTCTDETENDVSS